MEITDYLITAIGDAPAQGATTFDLSGQFVLLDLLDMHTHVAGHLECDFFANLFSSPHRATICGGVNVLRDTLVSRYGDNQIRAPLARRPS